MDNTLEELARREPPVKFEIVMTSGDRLLIDDPTMLVFSGQWLVYYPPRTNAAVHMRLNQVSLVRIEDARP